MHAVLRTYTGPGAQKLADLAEHRKKDVEGVLRSVPGLVSYSLIRAGDTVVSVTVCKDKAGTDQSISAVAKWVKENAANTGASPPAVSEGAVIIQLS